MSSTVRIVKLPGSRAPLAAPPDRSPNAHAQLARARARGFGGGADADAFMAVVDAAQEDAAMAASGASAAVLGYGDGDVGVSSRSPCPGRPDLEIIRGRGTNGCTYIMTGRVKKQEPVYVRGYEDQDQDDDAIENAIVMARQRG